MLIARIVSITCEHGKVGRPLNSITVEIPDAFKHDVDDYLHDALSPEVAESAPDLGAIDEIVYTIEQTVRYCPNGYKEPVTDKQRLDFLDSLPCTGNYLWQMTQDYGAIWLARNTSNGCETVREAIDKEMVKCRKS